MATSGKTFSALLILLLTFGLLLNSCMAAYILASGTTLGTGQSLNYAVYQFIMQSDCNLVLYDNGNAVWASGTDGRGSGCQSRMQYDGNLVVYTDANQAVWASNTNRGTGSYQCILQRDRNVVVYDPQGMPIWSTRTNVLAATNVTLPTVAGKPTNVTVTPVEKTTVSNPTDGMVTAVNTKIDRAVKPTLT